MQSPQQEIRSHTLMHSSASLPIFPAQETSFLPPVDARKSSQSLWDLTLVQFLYLDLNKLNIHPLNKVADTSSQEECVLEIEISDVPCLQVARNFQEITAFCNILMIKFSDAKWPERLSEYDTSKDKDQWTKTLMKAIEKVLELAKTSPPQKRIALCILYAFLIDKETAEKIRKESIMSPSGKSPIRSETRQSRSWSDGHIEISLDKTTEILLNVVRELEIKAQGMDIDDDEYAEEAMAKMDLENKNKDHTPQANSNPEIDTEKLDDTFQGRKSSVKHDSLILKKNLSSGQKEARQALSLQDNNINSQSSDIGVRNGAVAAEVEALNQIKMAAKSETPKVKVGEKIKDFFSRAFTKKVYSEPLKVEQIKSDKTEKTEKVEKVEKAEKIEKVEKPEKVEPSPAPISKEPKDLNVIPLIQNLSDMSIWRDLSIETPRDQSENDISMDRDSEDFYEKRRDTRDGSRTARSEDSIKNSPSHQDLSKLIKKEIPNFAGQIYMKLSAASTWNKYFARLHDSNLVLYSSPSDKAPVHVIPCFRSTISYVEKPEKDYIEIFHKFDSERVQILMDPNSQGQNDSHDPFKNLRMWYIQLKIITQKTHGLKLPFNNYYPIGKVQLTVSQASQIKGLPNNSTCYIRIYHIPYTLSTRQITASETLKWKQSFFLPLCDNFLPIKLELVSVFHEGWLKDTIKEEVICTKDIRATDIISLKLDGTFTVNLNMQYTEAKRKLLGKNILTPEGEVIHPTIKLKIKHLSTMHVLFSPAYGDFVEGVHMDRETYVKQHFKLSIRRVKRIVRYIKLFIADFNSIFYYKYPVFSYFCILLFSYVIVVTQVENILANFVFFIVLLSVCKHPKVESRIKPILTEIFFREDLRNSYYSVPTVKSLEDIATQKDLNTEKWKFKIVDEDNLVTQLLVIKRILTGISIGLTKAAGFCEKLKNIILWKEPARTSLFICFGVVIYCVLALLPLRWSLLLIVWLRFLQGMDYYKKLRTRNEEVAKMTINFIVKRSFPAYCQQIWRRPNAIWPTALNFVNFQKKMIDQLNFRLGVVLPDDALCVLKSPQELVTALATCSKSLKFKTNQTEKANLAMVRWKDPTFNAKNLLNFIMNAPSDYYRVTHPNVIHPEPDSPTLSEDISPR